MSESQIPRHPVAGSSADRDDDFPGTPQVQLGALREIMDEVQNHSVEFDSIEWGSLPDLYLLHYRGHHHYRDLPTDFSRQALGIDSPIFSAACLEAGSDPTVRAQKIIKQIRLLNDTKTPIKMRTRTHPTPLAALLQRYVQSMEWFLQEIKLNSESDHRPLQKESIPLKETLENLIFSTNPFVSTSGNPYHALRFGSGVAATYPNPFSPEYSQEFLPTYPIVGEIFGVAHSLPQWASSGAQSSALLTKLGHIAPNNRKQAAGDMIFPGFIPGEHIIFHEQIHAPPLMDPSPQFVNIFNLTKRRLRNLRVKVQNHQSILENIFNKNNCSGYVSYIEDETRNVVTEQFRGEVIDFDEEIVAKIPTPK